MEGQRQHLAILVLLLLVEGLAGDAMAGADASQRRQALGSTRSPALQQPRVIVKEGRLSVTVSRGSLGRVLEHISRQAGVAILVVDEAAARQPLSIRIEDLPMEQALRLILKDCDAFFFYGVTGKSPAALQVVWVYAKGRGRGLMPVPPELWASTKDVERRLEDRDPGVRAKAIGTLIERKGSGARDAVMFALKDEEVQVRTEALYGSLMAGLPLPPETLSGLLLSDPSPDIRFLALQAIGDDPGARSLVEYALNDPSPHVRATAQAILKRWDHAAQPQQPTQPVQGEVQSQPR